MAVADVIWDMGTAYDLFISLEVLHDPASYGVRGAWAAGVRARLPTAEREMLEESQAVLNIPFHWIHSLPDPKDGTAVLWALGQIPAAERLPALALGPEYPSAEATAVLRAVAERGTWDEKDQEALQTASGFKKRSFPAEKLIKILDWWSRVEEFGERYLEALRTYQDVFFAEEEERIRPALQEALSRAQELAQKMTLPDLVEELSQGVRLSVLDESATVVLAPSYWGTPLIFMGMSESGHRLFLFGARPPDASLVPGEAVPDSLLRTLKALSDPTRLRILHYLAEEPQTPAQLARHLRLRAPTVTHHLKTLRLAGLVQLSLGESKEMRHYAARQEAVSAAFDALKDFIG